MWSRHLGRTIVAKICIKLVGDETHLVHEVSYVLNQSVERLWKFKIETLLSQKIIEPAQIGCAAPIVFVPIKKITLLFCVDKRKLNADTKRDLHPKSRKKKCIDYLVENAIIFTIYAKSKYRQVEIDVADRHKTAFVSHFGYYCFTRMLFGLQKTPGIFRRTINAILSTYGWKFALVY